MVQPWLDSCIGWKASNESIRSLSKMCEKMLSSLSYCWCDADAATKAITTYYRTNICYIYYSFAFANHLLTLNGYAPVSTNSRHKQTHAQTFCIMAAEAGIKIIHSHVMCIRSVSHQTPAWIRRAISINFPLVRLKHTNAIIIWSKMDINIIKLKIYMCLGTPLIIS